MSSTSTSGEPGDRVEVPYGQGVQVGNNNKQENYFINPHIDLGPPQTSFAPGEPAYRETLRVIRGRTRQLIGRSEELLQLVDFATSSNQSHWCSYLWLFGKAWTGKTALLAEAVHVLPDMVASVDAHEILVDTESDGELDKTVRRGADVVAYFLVSRESQASREQFIGEVASQLAYLLNKEMPARVDVHLFRQLWAEASNRAESMKRRLLLLVDGLDEDPLTDGLSIAALLPTEHLGAHARVIVTSRPHPDIPNDVDLHHPLRLALRLNLSASPHAVKTRDLAQQEINALLSSQGGRAADIIYQVLGLLTAAAGALSVDDISKVTGIEKPVVRNFLTIRAARSLEPVLSIRGERYQFAHQTLFEYCQEHPDVGGNQQYRSQIHEWALTWRSRMWPTPDISPESTPIYLLDSYPASLSRSIEGQQDRENDAGRLADLVSDICWVDAAVGCVGIESTAATLRAARRICPDRSSVTMMAQVVERLARISRSSDPIPSATSAALAWSASSIGFEGIAKSARQRMRQYPRQGLVPIWTNGISISRMSELKRRHDGALRALAMSDGFVISAGGIDGAVRQWDPAIPDDTGRVVGLHQGVVPTIAVMEDGRIVSGGLDGAIRLWSPSVQDDQGREVGRHDGAVLTVAVMGDGRIVSGGLDGSVRLWNTLVSSDSGHELGRHTGQVRSITVTEDGLIVSAGNDGAIRLWDPSANFIGSRIIAQWQPVVAVAVIRYLYVLAVGLDGAVRLWDPPGGGGSYRELSSRNGVRSIALTADRRVMCGCADGAVRLWDPAMSNDKGRELAAHRGAIWSLVVSTDGRVVVANDRLITVLSWKP